MRSELEHNRSAASEQDTGPAQALRRARLLERTDLPHSETAYEFQGNDHGAIGGLNPIVQTTR
jgi:hypothetical protein